jgi:predicted ribosomally synthesized peptide with SipW-like signal peptide
MNKRILVSLIVIGVVGASVGVSSLALFNDQETSANNEFTTGTLDLKVDWRESYNGEEIERQKLTNDPGSIFNFEDIKPGDHGNASISLHLDDNPGWIWMKLDQTSSGGTCVEPERKVEGDCGTTGELDEELEFVIWADDGDGVREDNENIIFQGTGEELEEQSISEEGVLLDGNPSTDDTEPFPGEETGYVGVKWKLPRDTGNIVQADSITYDIGFYTEQRRHNDNPDNPWSDSDEEPENEPPVASFERANDKPFSTTVGTDVRLYSTSTDDDEITKKKWELGDGTTKFGQDIWHSWEEEGNYTVTLTVTDSDGEKDSVSHKMEVKANENGEPSDEIPEADFSYTKENRTVTFNASSSTDDKGIGSYSWNFGDGETGSGEVVEHTYNESGSYDVELTVTDTSGQTDTSTRQVTVGETGDNETTVYTAVQGNTTVELQPLEGDQTVQELYDFRLPDRYDNQADNDVLNGATYPGTGPYYESAGTGDLQQQETSIMFLYDGPNGLSLVVVHDMAGGDGGSATWEISDLPESGQWVVKDDLYLDSDGTKASSNYDDWDVNSEPQTINWTWGGGGTDGGAFQPLGDDFSFTIDPAFNEESPIYEEHYNGDIDEWQVLSGDRSNPDRTTLELDEEVQITAN